MAQLSARCRVSGRAGRENLGDLIARASADHIHGGQQRCVAVEVQDETIALLPPMLPNLFGLIQQRRLALQAQEVHIRQ